MRRLSVFLPIRGINTTTPTPTRSSSFFHYCKELSTLSLLHHPTTGSSSFMDSTATSPYRRRDSHHRQQQKKMKVIVIMGATGSGKSRLSVELASRFFPSAAEIINSDKMQVYSGLDITTNKISMRDRLGVPHHHLGDFDPTQSRPVFTPSDFRSAAASTISRIASRRRLPLIVGGSNSFIYALLAKRFDPSSDVFDDSIRRQSGPVPVSTELRYNCCFLWVDVAPPVLNQYLCKRVDEMLDSGMLEELSEYYGGGELKSPAETGLKQSIGVPEFEKYFNDFGGQNMCWNLEDDNDRKTRAYDEAVRAIKDNTCQLAKKQLWKIQRLKDAGWDLRKVNATEAFKAAMGSGDSGGKKRAAASEIWERHVVEPSVKIVKRFLEE